MWRVESQAPLPERFGLSQNYPNPFNPITFIDFSLPQPSNVRIEVFNLLGQSVATLTDGNRPAGYHTVSWNGLDASGAPVASGVYFYRLTADEFRASNKMLLVR
jgi:flagellar hook assembly protein FlgD